MTPKEKVKIIIIGEPSSDAKKLAENSLLQWKVNTPAFLKEIGQNSQTSILRQPLMIFASILGEVAERASQLNDDKLNALMCRLALYEISDPYSKEYNGQLTNEIIEKGKSNE